MAQYLSWTFDNSQLQYIINQNEKPDLLLSQVYSNLCKSSFQLFILRPDWLGVLLVLVDVVSVIKPLIHLPGNLYLNLLISLIVSNSLTSDHCKHTVHHHIKLCLGSSDQPCISFWSLWQLLDLSVVRWCLLSDRDVLWRLTSWRDLALVRRLPATLALVKLYLISVRLLRLEHLSFVRLTRSCLIWQ